MTRGAASEGRARRVEAGHPSGHASGTRFFSSTDDTGAQRAEPEIRTAAVALATQRSRVDPLGVRGDVARFGPTGAGRAGRFRGTGTGLRPS
jgi:hypothetical protein